VAAWHELRSARPELAAAGRDLLYPHGMRYVLHSLPREDNEDTFSISGHAWLKEDPSTRRSLEEQFVREHEALGVPTPDPNDALFRFDIESCVLTRASGRGDFTPSHKVWRP